MMVAPHHTRGGYRARCQGGAALGFAGATLPFRSKRSGAPAKPLVPRWTGAKYAFVFRGFWCCRFGIGACVLFCMPPCQTITAPRKRKGRFRAGTLSPLTAGGDPRVCWGDMCVCGRSQRAARGLFPALHPTCHAERCCCGVYEASGHGEPLACCVLRYFQ